MHVTFEKRGANHLVTQIDTIAAGGRGLPVVAAKGGPKRNEPPVRVRDRHDIQSGRTNTAQVEGTSADGADVTTHLRRRRGRTRDLSRRVR